MVNLTIQSIPVSITVQDQEPILLSIAASAIWGGIVGNISSQTDLALALADKMSFSDIKWGVISGDIVDQTDLANALASKASDADIRWGNISGDITNQSDLQNALVDFVSASDVRFGKIVGAISDQTNLQAALDSKISAADVAWGKVIGSIGDQSDLQNALSQKADVNDIAWGNIDGYITDQTDLQSELSQKITASDVAWGKITGSIVDQTDLQNTLNGKADLGNIPTQLSQLTQDATHRVVTDSEKATWNSKTSLILGETPTTAYRGDRGYVAYGHSQATGNPHSATQDNIPDGTTYKQYSATEKAKLSGIAAGAEVNVNADWNAVSGDAQILNKPSLLALGETISTAYRGDRGKIAYDHSQTTGNPHGATQDNIGDGTTYKQYSQTEKTKLAGIETGAQVNVPTNLSLGTITAITIPVNSSTGTSATLPVATTSLAGLESAADKTKLDGIESGAEVNVNADWNAVSGDAQILNKPALLALGETSTTAYRGDRGKTAYDHSQTTGNPHSTAISDISTLTGKITPLSDLSRVMALNGDGIPMFPDNVAGRTYQQDGWATTDSWYVAGLTSATLSVADGILKATATGSQTYCGMARSSLTLSGKIVVLKVRSSTSGSFAVAYDQSGWQGVKTEVLTAGVWTFVSALIPSTATTSSLILYKTQNTGTLELDTIYIGSGAYDTKVYGKDGQTVFNNVGVLPVPGPRGMAMSCLGNGSLVGSSPIIGQTGHVAFKFKRGTIGTEQYIFDNADGTTSGCNIRFNAFNTIRVGVNNGNSYGYGTQVITDTVSWHSAVINFEATAIKFYIDAVLAETIPSPQIMAAATKALSVFNNQAGTQNYNGLLTDINIGSNIWTQDDVTRYHNGDDAVDSQQKSVTNVPHAIKICDSKGNVREPGLSVYADNTAALAGGLVAGEKYRTSTGVLMVVY